MICRNTGQDLPGHAPWSKITHHDYMELQSIINCARFSGQNTVTNILAHKIAENPRYKHLVELHKIHKAI
jgi:hypothetical protein